MGEIIILVGSSSFQKIVKFLMQKNIYIILKLILNMQVNVSFLYIKRIQVYFS